MSDIRYQRDVLVEVLHSHQTTTDAPRPYAFMCLCGWGAQPEHLGRPWADHVADVYEAKLLGEGS